MAESGKPSGTRAAGRRCCFADAVGARIAGCTKAMKSTQQHRRTVRCVDDDAHGVCAAWLDQVRRASRFTLGTPRSPSALPRRQATKLQCGGLLGIRETIDGSTDGARIQDVSALLRRVLSRFGSFDQVPLDSVVQHVQRYENDGGSKR